MNASKPHSGTSGAINNGRDASRAHSPIFSIVSSYSNSLGSVPRVACMHAFRWRPSQSQQAKRRSASIPRVTCSSGPIVMRTYPLAAWIRGTIAQQDAVLAHDGTELLVPRADIHENEVCCAWPGAHAERIERRDHALTSHVNLERVPVQVRCIRNGLRQYGQRDAVDIVGGS